MENEESKTGSAQSSVDSNLKRRAKLFGGFMLMISFVVVLAWWYSIRMPGNSYHAKAVAFEKKQASDSLPADPQSDVSGASVEPATDTQLKAVDEIAADNEERTVDISGLAKELERYVVHLATTIGERNIAEYDALCEAADYLESQLKSSKLELSRQTYQLRGKDCFNIIAERLGTELPEEVVIIGAHYDSVLGTPGANDNASGVASMLALANHFSDHSFKRTIRFVGFTNEEPPYFQNEGEMGSWVYAEECRQADEKIVAVLSLETMGYFSDDKDSQQYPAPLSVMYPSTGNFIGFVANLGSRPLLHKALKCFREHAQVPSEGAALPGQMPGVGWSDHWSFWQEGYQGLMITDTAPFRYPHYHRSTDTPDKLKYENLAQVVEGLKPVVELLTNEPSK